MCNDGTTQKNPNYAVIDTEFVTVCDYEAVLFRSKFASTYRGAKLGAEPADGSPIKIQGVVRPSDVRATMAGWLKDEERAAHITNVDARMNLLTVMADPTTPGRVLFELPVVPVPGLHQWVGNLRQLSF